MQLKNKIRIRKNSRLLLFNDVLKAAITFSGNLLSSWCHIGNGKLAHGLLLKIHQNTADYQLQFSRWYVLRDWTRETESVTEYGHQSFPVRALKVSPIHLVFKFSRFILWWNKISNIFRKKNCLSPNCYFFFKPEGIRDGDTVCWGSSDKQDLRPTMHGRELSVGTQLLYQWTNKIGLN